MRHLQGKVKRAGSATVFSILFSAVLITLALAFNLLVRENLKFSITLKYKMDALITAHSALNVLTYNILSGVITNREVLLPSGNRTLQLERLPLNGTFVEIRLPERVLVSLRDTNGLLSLSYINLSALRRLILMKTNNDSSRADIFIDSLLDWIDRDDLTRLNGAETDFYRAHNYPYIPRNYPLQYKEEILLIRGMDKELYKKIEPYLTILPANGFNPNTAPDEVLMAYLDLDNPYLLEPLKKYLQQRPILSDLELFALTGRRIVVDEGVFYYPSRYVELTIQVPSGNRTLFTLRAGLDLRLAQTKPFEILYLKEE